MIVIIYFYTVISSTTWWEGLHARSEKAHIEISKQQNPNDLDCNQIIYLATNWAFFTPEKLNNLAFKYAGSAL